MSNNHDYAKKKFLENDQHSKSYKFAQIDFDKRLIAQVRLNPILYTTCGKQKNKNKLQEKIDHSWKEISKCLKVTDGK